MLRHNRQSVTNPTYISPEMFDRIVTDKFQQNPDDQAVRQQAVTLVKLLRASKTRGQIIVDVLHAANISGNRDSEGIAEIGFAMGMQFGFELGLAYPPLNPQ